MGIAAEAPCDDKVQSSKDHSNTIFLHPLLRVLSSPSVLLQYCICISSVGPTEMVAFEEENVELVCSHSNSTLSPCYPIRLASLQTMGGDSYFSGLSMTHEAILFGGTHK